MTICAMCFAEKQTDMKLHGLHGTVIEVAACKGCHYQVAKVLNFLKLTGNAQPMLPGPPTIDDVVDGKGGVPPRPPNFPDQAIVDIAERTLVDVGVPVDLLSDGHQEPGGAPTSTSARKKK